MPHLLGDSQLLRRGLLGEACVDEGLGGSVSVESGSGCVTAGSGVCVCGGAHVQVCFTVCICAVGFCAHTSVVLCIAVDVCYGACDPAVLGVCGGTQVATKASPGARTPPPAHQTARGGAWVYP